MISRRMNLHAHFLMAALLVCTFVGVAIAEESPSGQSSSKGAVAAQLTFATAQQAADALIKAVQDYDVDELMKLFGPGGADIVSSADPVHDKTNAAAFAEKARVKNTVVVDPKNKTKALLVVGEDDWPLPVPIVKRNGKWLFDAKAGRTEILRRRIGGNELDAIQICRRYVDAQREYAFLAREVTGVNQYAQKIISTPGKKDGLYWTNEDGSSGGPISEGIAKAIQEGYSIDRKSAFHGYYFKILKGQGPAAPLGRIDYVIEGVMIGGFGLLAVPADYGVTGIKSFIVSNDGIVYEKDLGPKSIEVGKQMELYNPDKTWKATDDGWPSADTNKVAQEKTP